MRHCKSINVYALDRPRTSCVHRTKYCAKHCYNKKLYKMYKGMRAQKCEKRLEREWLTLTGETVAKQLARKRKATSRFRGCTRGENIETFADVARWLDIATKNKGTIFWLPTRAWRDDGLRGLVQSILMPLDNVRIMASMDPSNTPAEWAMLLEAGWSTMFFGDDDMRQTPTGAPMMRCPKTWGHQEGACLTCTTGCFENGQKNVHLKQH